MKIKTKNDTIYYGETWTGPVACIFFTCGNFFEKHLRISHRAVRKEKTKQDLCVFFYTSHFSLVKEPSLKWNSPLFLVNLPSLWTNQESMTDAWWVVIPLGSDMVVKWKTHFSLSWETFFRKRSLKKRIQKAHSLSSKTII